MLGYECLLRGAGHLVDARDRAEIVETARAAAADGTAWARLAELASVVAFALRPRRARTIWVHGALIAAVLVALAAATPLALIVPFLLLALGARPAAAATLFWLWRLATADLGEVLAALDSAAFARWSLMLAGVAVAAYVTRASMRRAAAL
jgi:hypothetical protein